MIEPIKISNVKERDKDEIDRLHNFYEASLDKDHVKIHLNRLKIVIKLRELGFYRFDQPDGTSQLVRVDQNKIKVTTKSIITDALEDYIRQLPDRQHEFRISEDTFASRTITSQHILEQLYQGGIGTYLTPEILDRLRPDEPIELLTDGKTSKWFYFNNTAVKVTEDKIIPVPYNELDRLIWENSIINRNFDYSNNLGDFETFISDITGNDEGRKKCLMSMIGYLLHDFYETDLRAVLLTDVNKDDFSENAGGTGKGLIGKALGQMLNREKADNRYCTIPGKGLDLSDKNRYDRADISTQLIHIEDIEASRFNFELLYNDITDGATLSKKYQITPTMRLIKFMISTNKTIDVRGSSNRRRLVIFELSNYYSDSFRPIDKFGRRFFESSWREDDWNDFYTFMMRCCMIYLSEGIIEAGQVNYNERFLKEKIGEDFIFLFEQYLNHAVITGSRVEVVKQQLYQDYCNRYCLSGKRPAQRTITNYCRTYLQLKNAKYCEIRSGNDLIIVNPTTSDYELARIQRK